MLSVALRTMDVYGNLNSKPECRIIVDDSLATVCLRIASSEVQRQNACCQDDEHVARHTRRKAWDVGRCVLCSKNQGTSNTSNTAQSSQGSRAKSPSPLPADVVGLIRHDGRYSAVGAADSDEDSHILTPRVLDKAHDRQSDEGDEAEEAYNRAAYPETVTEPSRAVHHEATRRVRRRAHALSHCDAELQLRAQDDWQEECETVRDGRDAEEDECEAVDVPLCCWGEELLPGEWFGCDVTTIGVELVNDKVDVAGILEEAPRWFDFLLIGKLDDEGNGKKGDTAGYDTFHNENP